MSGSVLTIKDYILLLTAEIAGYNSLRKKLLEYKKPFKIY